MYEMLDFIYTEMQYYNTQVLYILIMHRYCTNKRDLAQHVYTRVPPKVEYREWED